MRDRSKRCLRDLCAQIHEDDRALTRSGRSMRDATSDRKTLQLCKQVRQAIEALLPQSHWAIGLDVHVDAVTPAPDASTLQITLATREPEQVRVHALEALPAMRATVAGAIARKRAPMLTLVVLGHDVHDEREENTR